MPQQKRKASAIASAKIAEEAGSGRKRKSDAKEEQNPSTKETDKNVETEQNVSEKVNEPSDNKRRKKQTTAQETHEQQHDNGTNGNEPLHEHDQMLIDEYNKDAKSFKEKHNGKAGQAVDKEVNDVQNETKKELEKKMAPNTLEKGHICFFYRPKVDAEEVHSTDDVQRNYMVLIPYMTRPSVSEEPIPSYFQQVNDNKKIEADELIPGKVRIIGIGKKKLPEIEKHTKSWAFVDKAFTDMNEIKNFVSGKKYQTKTRGERTLSACRLMGRGVYNIVEHKGHTHLAYVLEFPEEPSEIQDDFNIKNEGSYVISVKNPETSSLPNVGLPEYEKVTYPTHLTEKFGGRRFLSLASTDFMDYDGAELLLIGARDDITGELDESGKELEELADFEVKVISPLTAERVIFDELNLEKKVLPSEPLHGLWK
uniref:Uncharacterized protein n=1 Tax=Anthurium amnicola TaxID=1678845 RepID=A0A1D1YGL8_9ARAE